MNFLYSSTFVVELIYRESNMNKEIEYELSYTRESNMNFPYSSTCSYTRDFFRVWTFFIVRLAHLQGCSYRRDFLLIYTGFLYSLTCSYTHIQEISLQFDSLIYKGFLYSSLYSSTCSYTQIQGISLYTQIQGIFS